MKNKRKKNAERANPKAKKEKRVRQEKTSKILTNAQLLVRKRIFEAIFVAAVFVSVFLFAALFSYHYNDPAWSHAATGAVVQNVTGLAGAWISDVLLYILGLSAYFFPVSLLVVCFAMYRQAGREAKQGEVDLKTLFYWIMHAVGFILIMSAASGLMALYIPADALQLPLDPGGVLGMISGVGVEKFFNLDGATIILTAMLLIGVTLFTGLSWTEIFAQLSRMFKGSLSHCRAKWLEFKDRRADRLAAKKAAEQAKIAVVRPPKAALKAQKSDAPVVQLPLQAPEKPLSAELKAKPKVVKPKKVKQAANLKLDHEPRPGEMPPVSLLNDPPVYDANLITEAELQQRSSEVEARLADFNVEAKVVAVHPGPVVTRFELDLAAGTKVSKITTLAKDLARSLSVMSVRVVEVIPGKSYIGLELPNSEREMVALSEVLSSQQYHSARSPLSLGLGKDIAGHPVVVDLAKMPHLLIAGTTGSGKSVGVNTILMSMLYKCRPEELRLIMIDPKMLELSVYDDIPHLLAPVVTDMNDAATALRWCVVEMERRYKLMAALGVRNIAGYNVKVKEAKQKGAPLLDPLVPAESMAPADELSELPRIVVIADEFADMMVVVGKKVETLIARLAQKARAAGIHLVLATQRPSVDVITGLIKANIPTRMSFQVSSKIDSRTILDQPGAEQLLGQGDMLYLPPGSGVPVRVHGAFVSDDEVHRVVEFLKLTGQPDYLEAVLDESAGEADSYVDAAIGAEGGTGDAEQDGYYDQAVDFIARSQRVSISSIQRRFKIGYNRAANIVEAMEAAGVVSAMEQNGSRRVLVPKPEGA